MRARARGVDTASIMMARSCFRGGFSSGLFRVTLLQAVMPPSMCGALMRSTGLQTVEPRVVSSHVLS